MREGAFFSDRLPNQQARCLLRPSSCRRFQFGRHLTPNTDLMDGSGGSAFGIDPRAQREVLLVAAHVGAFPPPIHHLLADRTRGAVQSRGRSAKGIDSRALSPPPLRPCAPGSSTVCPELGARQPYPPSCCDGGTPWVGVPSDLHCPAKFDATLARRRYGGVGKGKRKFLALLLDSIIRSLYCPRAPRSVRRIVCRARHDVDRSGFLSSRSRFRRTAGATGAELRL